MHTNLNQAQREKALIQAFTLVELIAVVGMTVIIAAIGISIGLRSVYQQQIDSSQDLIVSGLYEAQALARASASQSNWGLTLQNNQLIIFAGDSYASRDQSQDITFEVDSEVAFSSEFEIVFNRISGLPNSQLNLQITNSAGVRNINVNNTGTISLS